MNNLDLIRDNYASMPVEKLITIAKEDSPDLTEEALSLLKQEFASRNLNIETYLPINQELQEEENSVPKMYDFAKGADKPMIGLSYQDMMYPINEKEVIEKENLLTQLTAKDLEQLIEKNKTAMQKNGVILAIGLAVTLATLSIAENGGSYVVAWGAILFGGIGLVKAFDEKNKYQQLLNNINEKKEGSLSDEND
jgi:hypothetical protein